jgi:hypothetical protein
VHAPCCKSNVSPGTRGLANADDGGYTHILYWSLNKRMLASKKRMWSTSLDCKRICPGCAEAHPETLKRINEGDYIPYTPLVTQRSMLVSKNCGAPGFSTKAAPWITQRHTGKQLKTIKAQMSAAAVHEAGGRLSPAGGTRQAHKQSTAGV